MEVLKQTSLKHNEEDIKNIKHLFSKVKKNDEFEFVFFRTTSIDQSGRKIWKNSMIIDDFNNVLNYINVMSRRNNMKYHVRNFLDVTYSYSSDEVLRLSIEDEKNANYILDKYFNKTNIAYSFMDLLKAYVKTEPDSKKFKTNIKKRDKKDSAMIEDYDVKIKLANEEDDISIEKATNILNKIDANRPDLVTLRWKSRTSLILFSSNNETLSLDMTNVKMGKDHNKLNNLPFTHELELDYTLLGNKPSQESFDMILKYMNSIITITQSSLFPISNSEKIKVLEEYYRLTYPERKDYRPQTLEGRKPRGLEIQHVIGQLPNKYCVTDKADGERNFLIIYNKHTYLINQNLKVKNIGIKIKNNDYNSSMIDGEYIFIKNKKVRKHVFLAFDCIFHQGKDVRKLLNFRERISFAMDIVENCFTTKEQEHYTVKTYNGAFDTDKIVDFHSSEIDKYMISLNKGILTSSESTVPLIRVKYFIHVQGGKPNEIFKYSKVIWTKYVTETDTKCPYVLDGLIYQPNEQTYTTKAPKYFEYKWKPPHLNSIDFYTIFIKDNVGNDLIVFDKTMNDDIKINDVNLRNEKDEKNENNKYESTRKYKIAKLYVSKKIGNVEQPVLFEPNNEAIVYYANFFIENGEVRDETGSIINDKTVIEAVYSDDLSVPKDFRWRILRTRYDRTETVRKYSRNFGNNEEIAKKMWRSIKNPITISDISMLANDDSYVSHNNSLIKRIDHSIILSERKEDLFHRRKNLIGKALVQWNQWLMSSLIYTLFGKEYEYDQQLEVLETMCGRGEHVMKFYYVAVKSYVGIEHDNYKLISGNDGIISRYNKLRKEHPNFPNMFFINGDFSVKLNYSEQSNAVNNSTKRNKDLIDQFFSKNSFKKFDRILSQFHVDQVLENQTKWENFTENIKNTIKKDGLYLIICYDSDKIIELLKGKDSHSVTFNDNQGTKTLMYELIKKYNEKDDLNNVGNAFEIFNTLEHQEGKYDKFYLISKKFLVNEFDKRCGLKLVGTDNFYGQYIKNKDFFLNSVSYEEMDKTRKFLENAKMFYEDNSNNEACKELIKIHRYFIFKKN